MDHGPCAGPAATGAAPPRGAAGAGRQLRHGRWGSATPKRANAAARNAIGSDPLAVRFIGPDGGTGIDGRIYKAYTITR